MLGLELDYIDQFITLSQSLYAKRILERFDMTNTTLRNTLLDANVFPPRTEEGDESTDIKEYQQILGSINFLVVGTRLDLVYAAAMLSTFIANPNKRHRQLL